MRSDWKQQLEPRANAAELRAAMTAPMTPEELPESTCFVERSKVRELLISSNIDNESTREILADIDALPIYTAANMHGVAQQPGPALLWCCHVHGPDDVYAAPDYETALAWSYILNEMNWRSGAYPKPLGFQNPASYADCLVKAMPAPWPHSAEAHAEDLPKSIAGFSPPSNQGASK